MREAQTRKIPYSIVLGDNEKENNLVTYRKHGSEEKSTVSLEGFVSLVEQEVYNKSK